MYWALGSRDCDFALGAAITWTPNLNKLRRMDGWFGKTTPAGHEGRFKYDAAVCQRKNRPG